MHGVSFGTLWRRKWHSLHLLGGPYLGKGEFMEIPRENACSFNNNFQEQYLNKENKLW